jgi:hypothetical protein
MAASPPVADAVPQRVATRPRAKSAVYISRSRARMTVLADHGAPLGVSTWRAFNSAATARADMPVNSERIGAMARARSRASA